jgi:tRNA pseudouridine38-40 synthase
VTLFGSERSNRTRVEEVSPYTASGRDQAPLDTTVRIALGCSYDGTDFHGFAAQPGVRTVAGELLKALERMMGHAVTYTCAGRTDTGVHARAQVVHVDLDAVALARRYGLNEPVAGTELPSLRRSLDRQLAPEIAVWKAIVAPVGFDARRSALARRYRYDLDLDAHLDPLRRHGAWRIGESLDLATMRLAADVFVGEHNFAAFCRHPPDKPCGPITRRVTETRCTMLDQDLLRFEIEAQSFCHQMVRSIVGTLVDVGKGRWRPSDVVTLLRSGERTGAPSPAPPDGLCLTAVTYPEEFGGVWS